MEKHEKTDDEGGMVPPIVVPNADDRETVMAALMLYTAHVSVGLMHARVVPSSALDHVIRETGIAARLMRTLREQEATDAAEEVFKDTGTFAAFFRRVTEEFGDES